MIDFNLVVYHIGDEVRKLREKAEKKVADYEKQNLRLQAAALDYKVDAYNEVLSILRDTMHDVERMIEREKDQQKMQHYIYEENLKDIEIEWL